MSLYESRIRELLERTRDPSARAELLAELACYYARIGGFSDASRIVNDLRANFGYANTRIVVWVLLIEGLAAYFDGVRPESRDRILRAVSISRAAGILDLQALCASWSAHIEFNRQSFAEMGEMLGLAARCLDSGSISAQVRFHMVVALASMYGRDIECARAHSEIARRKAVEIGDDASLSALMYNRAAFALLNLRVDFAVGESDDEASKFIDMEVASAYSYNNAVRHEALGYVLDVIRARLDLRRGHAADALKIFERQMKSGRPLNFKSDDAVVALEYADCLRVLGNDVGALEVLRSVHASSAEGLQSDDRLLFANFYIRLCDALGEPIDRARFRQIYDLAMREYRTKVQEAAEAVKAVLLANDRVDR